MKQNLYNIQTEYLILINEIEANDGLLTEAQEEALKLNESNRDSKAIAYTEVIGGKEKLNDRIDEEIKRLQQLKKTNTNVIKRLKENLLNAVNLFGPFEVGLVKFGTRKSTSVEVDDVNSLPKEYKVVKVTESADKAAISKALKGKIEIDGCRLVEKFNLKIN